jgi:shikimate kinase
MNIFLIGFMGSGKTTLGKKIAARLGYSFIDMDKAIEQEQGKSIPDLFESHGEPEFRKIENEWLKNFNGDHTVVATGGGAPCFQDNLETMKTKGLTIYLHSSAENLAQRLYQSKSSRPLIEHVKTDLAQLADFVSFKLAERESFYKKSDLVFESFNVDMAKLDDLVEKLKSKLN